MESFYRGWQMVLAVSAGCGLAIWALAVFYFYVAKPAWTEIRKFLSLGWMKKIVFGAFVVGMIHYGATKSIIHYDGGIRQDPEHQNSITNNLVSIWWTRDTSQGVIVPTNATVYIDYRLSSNTNGNWESLGSTTVGRWHYSTMFANATNYDYNVWAYYIPPEPVHTNGVWVYKTVKDRKEKWPLPIRARVDVNGKAIATPAEKRKDEGK